MKPEDFKTLSCDQIIYYKGEKKKIDCIYRNKYSPLDIRITFSEDPIHCEAYKWDEICADCSLEAPLKNLKRFWRWRLTTNFGWSKVTEYYDDDFRSPMGQLLKFEDGWKISKRKLEDEFIDVGV